jgi:hypothetical protein
MLNMVRLLKGEYKATNEEMKKFQKGDTIWGNDENQEELKRWKIEEKEEAKKELAVMDFDSFQREALKGNGVQNDAANVWVDVDGKQYTVDISDVLDHEEAEPFEASAELESDLDAEAWTELYSQYLGE